MPSGTRRCAKLIGARTSLDKHSLVDGIGFTQKLACRLKPGRDPAFRHLSWLCRADITGLLTGIDN
jgi:hypothetical protein